MKRINREFCLTDESVNCYGYRLLTSGLEIDRYRPPVGFLMHERERGVAVMWTDFRLEGGDVRRPRRADGRDAQGQGVDRVRPKR